MLNISNNRLDNNLFKKYFLILKKVNINNVVGVDNWKFNFGIMDGIFKVVKMVKIVVMILIWVIFFDVILKFLYFFINNLFWCVF